MNRSIDSWRFRGVWSAIGWIGALVIGLSAAGHGQAPSPSTRRVIGVVVTAPIDDLQIFERIRALNDGINVRVELLHVSLFPTDLQDGLQQIGFSTKDGADPGAALRVRVPREWLRTSSLSKTDVKIGARVAAAGAGTAMEEVFVPGYDKQHTFSPDGPDQTCFLLIPETDVPKLRESNPGKIFNQVHAAEMRIDSKKRRIVLLAIEAAHSRNINLTQVEISADLLLLANPNAATSGQSSSLSLPGPHIAAADRQTTAAGDPPIDVFPLDFLPTLDFGEVQIGERACNPTPAPRRLMGDDPEDFPPVNGQICFTPRSIGPRSALLISQILADSEGRRRLFVEPLAGTGVGPGPAPFMEPKPLNFGDQPVGVASTAQDIILANIGTGPLTIGDVAIQGADPGDFVIIAGNDPGPVAPGRRRVIRVVFLPSADGPRSATLSVTNNAVGAPHVARLRGYGVLCAPGAGSLAANPARLEFGAQPAGGAGVARDVVLTNPGPNSVNIREISLAGLEQEDFTILAGSDPGPLAPNGKRVVRILFAPSSLGVRTAALAIIADLTGCPQLVPLLGHGIRSGPGILTVNPSSLQFGKQKLGTTSDEREIVLRNIGTTPLTITDVRIVRENPTALQDSPTGFEIIAGNNPGTLSPGRAWVIRIAFSPEAGGAARAALIITSDDVASPHIVRLQGEGAISALTIAPGSLDFGDHEPNSTSGEREVVLENTGSETLTIGSISIEGANPGDFSLTAGSDPATLDPQEKRIVRLTFTPRAEGTRTAELTITHSADGSPRRIPLQGRGTAPAAQLTPNIAEFGEVPLGQTSPAQQFRLQNVGTGPLVIQSVGLLGDHASDFVIIEGGGSGTLVSGEIRFISVIFTPQGSGPRTGTLQISTNAPGSPHQAQLLGSGSSPLSITCPANITVSTAAEQCAAPVAFSLNAAGGAPPYTFSASPPSGALFPVGTTTVTGTVTDSAGRSSPCTFTVTVNDTVPPVLSTPGDLIVKPAADQCSAAVTYTATATDNCGTASLTCSPPPGSTFPIGTTVVSCTATDASGNTTSRTFKVTVVDEEAPKLKCTSELTIGADRNSCSAVLNFLPPGTPVLSPLVTVTDNCSSVTLTASPASGTAFPIGTTIVNITATDASGNSSTCQMKVNVVDWEKPKITCPGNITQTAAPETEGANVSFTVAATDNCPGVTVICRDQNGQTVNSGDFFAVGETVVTCTATDGNGNTDTCTFKVEVVAPE